METSRTMFLVFRDLLVLLAGCLWLASAVAVVVDARRRFSNRAARTTCALIATLLPFAGPAIYLLVRPFETLADRHARRYRLAYLKGLTASEQQLPPSWSEPANDVEQQSPEFVPLAELTAV